MKEQLLNNPNKQSRLLDYIKLDFTDYSVGEQNIYNQGVGNIDFITYNPTASSQVIDHPTYGKVFQFMGDQHFYTDKPAGLFNTNYQIKIEFVPLFTRGALRLLLTGDFPPNSDIRDGFCIFLNQYADRYLQLFCMGPGSHYNRLFLPGFVEPVLETCIITYIDNVMFFESLRTNEKTSLALSNINQDNPLLIGGGYYIASPGNFIGLLKSLKIDLL